MTRLTVVTVLYRSASVLARTLPTWSRSARGLPVDFVFVDNAPDDGARKVVADCLDDGVYDYHADPANPGFAAGCNHAVALAAGTHIMLLNPDVWLGEDSLARVCAAVTESPDVPIAIGLEMGGRTYAGIDLNVVSLFVDRSAKTRRGPLGPSGGAAVLPVALFRRFDGLEAGLFAWGEDADLALRLYAGGIRTRVLDLGLRHEWGHSVSGDAGLTEFRAFLLARNRVLVGARTLTWPLLVIAAPLAVAAQLALAVRKARQGLLVPFLKGVAYGLAGAPAMRRAWQGRRFGVRALARYLRGEHP